MLPRHDGVDVVNLKAEKASEPVQSKIPRVSSLLEHPFSFFPKRSSPKISGTGVRNTFS
jgi:hypothetical protein